MLGRVKDFKNEKERERLEFWGQHVAKVRW